MRKLFVMLLICGTLAFGAGSVTWVSLGDGGTLTIGSAPANIQTVQIDNSTYTTLGLPEAGYNDAPGQPQVPVYRRLIEIPFGASVTVEARVAATETRVLESPLAPVQEPLPKSGPVPAFALDAKLYRTDSEFPADWARLVDVVEIRGRRVAVVEVYPVRYNPVTNTVVVAKGMTVDLRWSGADWSKTQQMRRRYTSPAFAGRLDGIVLNTERFAVDMGPSLPIGYLVIVPDAWLSHVQPLAQWRHRKGYDVFVRTVSEVGGSSSTAVKNYIQNAYDNWPIPPSFVLLVGDVDQIGYFVGQGADNPATDLNYAMVAGSDFLPDIDVSRASVASVAQLDSFVGRVIGYEQNTLSSGTSWMKKQYFIASADGSNHQVTERTHVYVMNKIRPLGVICDSSWMYYDGGAGIIPAINSGRSWVTYSGHGGETEWAEPSPAVDNAAVHALTNTDLIPYVQTYACLSGSFASSSYPECFSEAWIRSGRRGALAHLASSVTSYWVEDDTLERRVFDNMFDSSFTWIMGGANKAKIKFYQQMGSGGSTRRYFEMYNLMGDGAIDVVSLEPRTLTVAYPAVIPLGAYPLGVSVTATGSPVAGALVCAMARTDTTVFATAYTDASGSAVLNITTSAPDSIFVTVTGHNLVTYMGAALCLPSSSAYVMYLRHVVDDSAGGNNDHIVNPGETINLPVWVKNWGSATAGNVRTWMRATDPNITILDSLLSFGTIAAGDSAYSGAAGFRFAVAPSCSNGYALRFTLVTKDANDSTWNSLLTIAAGAPQLAYASSRVEDPPPGGNDNGMVEPGETGSLIVTLRNTGFGNAYAVTAILRSGDSRLAVLDSLGSFGNIGTDTTGNNDGDRFGVHADGAIPRETSVPCTLVVHAGAITTTQTFVLDIGVIRACDPIPDGPRTPAAYYAYDDTDTLYTEAPDFNWIEIRGVGTQLTLDDDQTQIVNLPSAFGRFRFYGDYYTQVSICSNGFMAPGSSTVSTYSNTALPSSEMPPLLAPLWDDLDPSSAGTIWHYHDVANHRFIVEWDSVPHWNTSTYEKFEVVLHDSTLAAEDGNSEFTYQYVAADQMTGATVGEQDPTMTIAIQALFDGTYHRGAAVIAAGRAIKFTTDAPETGVSESERGTTLALMKMLSLAPNPSRGRTVLSYSVPRQMKVRLGVYDQSGRLVARLFDGIAPAGAATAAWDGCDGRGRHVAQGVYFYRLEGDHSTLVRKTVMVE